MLHLKNIYLFLINVHYINNNKKRAVQIYLEQIYLAAYFCDETCKSASKHANKARNIKIFPF